MKEYNKALVALETMQEHCTSDIGVGELEKLKTEAEIELTKLKERHQKQQGNLMHGKISLHSEKQAKAAEDNIQNNEDKTNSYYIQKAEQILEKHDPSGYFDYHKARLEERGYQCGYNLSKLDPELADKVYTITGMHEENAFSIGMAKGREQLETDKQQEKDMPDYSNMDWKEIMRKEKGIARERDKDRDRGHTKGK